MASTVDSLLAKISRGGLPTGTSLPEVQDRSLNGVYLKVKSGLLSVTEIVENYVDLPGVLLSYINENKSRATRDNFTRVLSILKAISEVLPAE